MNPRHLDLLREKSADLARIAIGESLERYEQEKRSLMRDRRCLIAYRACSLSILMAILYYVSRS